jgi:DNA polymerase (family 10)
MANAELVLGPLRASPGVEWAEPVGSLRRGQDSVGDIEMIASVRNADATLAEMAALPDIERVCHRDARRIYFLINRVQVGVRCAPPASASATLLHLTGSPSHLDRLHQLAADRQLFLDGEGLHAVPDRRTLASTEEEIYAALGLPFIPPELRNGDDEIEAGLRGQLPSLVSRSDIRGDLHMHTQWSDGQGSVEAMVQRCVELGYEYLAITDHSPHSAASRNLSLEGVARQADEIAGVRERYPQITILHGCEVDILSDGRLDFPERVLHSLDIVLASLHDPAGQSARELLRRYRDAMKHPLVAIVTHPMNRPGPERRGYDLDVDRLFEAAAETGTVLEVDGAPSHLDLEASLARRAVEAGVTLAIDSDAHRAEMLERHMTLGLLTARRGWVEPRHVLNTRSLPDVLAAIAAKRQRR